MKKVFTLLFAVGSITLVSAQSTGQKNNPYSNSRNETERSVHTAPNQSSDGSVRKYGHETSSFTFKEKEAQIQKINRSFDRRIAEVKKSRYLRIREKSKQIGMLENQRSIEISQVQYRYEKNNDRYAGRGFDKKNSRKW